MSILVGVVTAIIVAVLGILIGHIIRKHDDAQLEHVQALLQRQFDISSDIGVMKEETIRDYNRKLYDAGELKLLYSVTDKEVAMQTLNNAAAYDRIIVRKYKYQKYDSNSGNMVERFEEINDYLRMDSNIPFLARTETLGPEYELVKVSVYRKEFPKLGFEIIDKHDDRYAKMESE